MSKIPSLVFNDGYPKSWIDYWVMLWSAAGMIGLVFSKFLLSMSIFGLSSLLLLPMLRGGKILPQWSRLWSDQRVWLGMIILFMVVVISGINSSNTGDWLHYIRLRLPMVTLPLAVAFVPRLRLDFFRSLLLLFIATCTVSSMLVLGDYLLHFDAIQAGISEGQPMDTPVNHIRYSLMIALSCLFSILLAVDYRRYRVLLTMVGIWLFVFIHILAVRSGIAVLYGSILLLTMMYIYRSRQWLRGASIVATIIFAVAVLVATIPSLQNKLYYMEHDLHQYLSGEGEQYSDSERIASIQAGWAVFSSSKWIGVGVGDIGAEMNQAYDQLNLVTDRKHLPHNQWIMTAASTGILGLVLTIVGFLWPLAYGPRNYYSLTILLVIGLSMMVEHTLESSVGVGLYALLTTMILWSRDIKS